MTSRFTAVAGFLAAATLLSGSAFGFAPEFDSDLPTVVITDKLPGAPASTPYDVNGVGAAATEYVFRYSDAFAVQDYVTDLRGNTFSQLKVLFNEFDSFTDGSVNSAQTLLINGETAATSVPTSAEVDSNGFLVASRYPDGGLDFRNRDFSGDDEDVNSGFDNIGEVTGHDILSEPQQRVVTLYIKGDTSDELAIKDFVVITTIEGEDGLTTSVASDPWVTVYEQDLLEGWAGGALGSLAGIPLNGTAFTSYGTGSTTGYTFTPAAGTPTGASNQTVAVSSNTSQIGFATWALDPLGTLALEANNLYRLRANIYSPNASSNEIARISLGNQFNAGLSTVSYNDSSQVITGTPATLSSSTDNNVYVYLLAEAGAATTKVSAEIVTFGITGQDYVIDDLQVRKMDSLDKLGTGVVILNQGGTVATPAASELLTPEASPTPFNTSSTAVTGETWAFGALNTAANVTSNLTSSQLSVTFPQSNGTAPPSFALLALAGGSTADPTVAGAFQVVAGKLYQLDIWASTNTPKTTANSMPDLRIDVVQQASMAAFQTMILDPVDGTSTAIPGAIGTSPRAYTLFWEPQTGAATSEATLSLTLLSLAKTYTSASTINVHRVTLTEYDRPAE